MGIQRYDCGNGEGMFFNDKNGEWVDYLTHNDIVEKLTLKNKELTEQLRLHSVIVSFVCDVEKGTKCKDPFPKYRTGVCRNCGGQSN